MKKQVKLLLELLSLIKGHKPLYFCGFLLVLISSVTKVLPPFFMLKIFDNAIYELDMNSLWFYTILIIVTTLIGAISEMLYQYAIEKFNRKLIIDLRARCYEHIQKLSGDYMTNYNSGDLFTILYRDIEEIPSIITTSLFSFLSNILVLVGLVLFLITLQVDLLVILACFQVAFFFIQKYYNKKIKETTMQIRSTISALNSSAQEMLGNLFAFVESGLSRYFRNKHDSLELDYAKTNIRGSYIRTLNHTVLNFTNSITIATLLSYGGYKVITGALTVGGLFTFNIYSQRFIGPIMQLVDFNNNLSSCSVSWNNVKQLLATDISVQNGTVTKTIEGRVAFENVSFSYDQETPILRDITLRFDTGNVYAIVGSSGVGKTTLVHLLFRLWDCNKGTITIDQINIKDFDIYSLQSQISMVSQNIFLLNDTIYNNIILGKPIPENELQKILTQADIWGFINSLPDKLNTMVGENGIKLSGGERQRISIARALLKQNPILIFDEATSMLDNATEDRIINILLDSFRNKTIILIAHRLSTIVRANMIYVLKDGALFENGNHEDLLKKEGHYYNLYRVNSERK